MNQFGLNGSVNCRGSLVQSMCDGFSSLDVFFFSNAAGLKSAGTIANDTAMREATALLARSLVPLHASTPLACNLAQVRHTWRVKRLVS